MTDDMETHRVQSCSRGDRRPALLILPPIAAGKLAGQVEDTTEAVVCRVCVRDMLLRFKPCMTEIYLHIDDARMDDLCLVVKFVSPPRARWTGNPGAAGSPPAGC